MNEGSHEIDEPFKPNWMRMAVGNKSGFLSQRVWYLQALRERHRGPAMRLAGDCWGPGWGGSERSVKEENLSGLVWDVADQGGNGIQNEARHSAEGAGHPGKAKGRRGTPLGQQGSLGWEVGTGRGGRNGGELPPARTLPGVLWVLPCKDQDPKPPLLQITMWSLGPRGTRGAQERPSPLWGRPYFWSWCGLFPPW